MTHKLILVDDHEMMRAGLRSLLEEHHDLEVAGEGGDGRAAIQLALALQPALVVMDISMPGLNGLEAARQIRESLPSVRILFLSVHTDRLFITEAIKVGGTGYLLKSAAASELLLAIRTLLQGRTYISPSVASDVIEAFSRGLLDPSHSAFDQLTRREREVLQLLAEGYTSKEIASALHLSTKTIESHRAAIMDRLSIRSVAGLTKYAIRQGLTSTEI